MTTRQTHEWAELRIRRGLNLTGWPIALPLSTTSPCDVVAARALLGKLLVLWVEVKTTRRAKRTIYGGPQQTEFRETVEVLRAAVRVSMPGPGPPEVEYVQAVYRRRRGKEEFFIHSKVEWVKAFIQGAWEAGEDGT